MKNSLLKIFTFFLFLMFNSCLNYETQFEGPYSDEDDRIPEKLDKELLFVAGASVYLADKFGSDITKIEGTGAVATASINNNHTKVVFKNFADNIKIYNIDTEKITGEIPNSGNAIWIDYHANNSTVYFLTSDGFLDTYGPEVLIQHPIDLKTQTVPNVSNIYGVAVLENGNFIYSFSAGFNEKVVFSTGNTIFGQIDVNTAVSHIRISKDEKFIWGRRNSYGDLFRCTIPGLSYSNEISTDLGAPIEYTNGEYTGYKIWSNGSISTPTNEVIQHSFGTITSIDY